MEIVIDEPGRRLALEERDERLPFRFVLLGLAVTLMIATPWRVAWEFVAAGAPPATWDPLPSVFVLAAGLYFIFWARGGTRLERLAVDLEAERIDWRHSHLAGLVAWSGHLDLRSVESVTVERESGELKAAAKGSKPRPLRLNVSLAARSGGVTRLQLQVDRVNQAADVAAFAARLGSAAGLNYGRVLRDDAHAYAIAVRRDASHGAQATGSVSGRALASPTGAFIPPFDPPSFRGSLKVETWEPGREVRFGKGWNAYILLTPLLSGVFLPVLAWLRLPSLHEGEVLPRFVSLVAIAVTGLLLFVVGAVGVWMGSPRSVRFDWANKELILQAAWSRRVIPLPNIQSIEMRDRVYRHRNINAYTAWYLTAIRVILKTAEAGASRGELLIETVGSKDPTEASAMAVPLVTELSTALKVPVLHTPAD